jgi:hypothetical protein
VLTLLTFQHKRNDHNLMETGRPGAEGRTLESGEGERKDLILSKDSASGIYVN